MGGAGHQPIQYTYEKNHAVTFFKGPFGMVFHEKKEKKKTEAESKEKVRKLKKQTPRRLKKRTWAGVKDAEWE